MAQVIECVSFNVGLPLLSSYTLNVSWFGPRTTNVEQICLTTRHPVSCVGTIQNTANI